MVIHTFGDYLNFHPHIHVLAADGLFGENGMFYVMPEKGLKALEQLFRDRVIKFLINEGRTEAEFSEKLRRWKHSGFSVYRGVGLLLMIGKDLKASPVTLFVILSRWIRSPIMSKQARSSTAVNKIENHGH